MNPIDQMDIVLRRRNDTFFAGIPQIGLYAKADGTTAALAKLEEKKALLFADGAGNELLEEIARTYRPARMRSQFSDLRSFAIKFDDMNRIDQMDIVLRRRNDTFFAGIPQIGLCAEADSANAALAKLEEKKALLFADGADNELLEEIARTYRPAMTRSQLSDLRSFVIKLVLVAVVIVGVLLVARKEVFCEG